MQTKSEILLKRMLLLYENIYSLLTGFQKAEEVNVGEVPVLIKKEDGTTQTINIKSLQGIQTELKRIESYFTQLTSDSSFEYQSDGTISKYQKISQLNTDLLSLSNFDGSKCIVSNNSIIEDFVFPSVKLPIKIKSISSNSDSKIFCKIYEISDGFDNITDSDLKEIKLQWLNQQNKIQYRVFERELSFEKQQLINYGEFIVESVQPSKHKNVYNCVLNKVQYTSLYTIGDNINLKIDDLLVSKDGNSKYKIIDIDLPTKVVSIQLVSGLAKAPVISSEPSLIFNEKILNHSENYVGLPVKPNKKIIVFFSSINNGRISYPSNGLKIDTSNFKVENNGTTFTIDEYYAKYVTDFSSYLSAIVNDITIPTSLGIKPNKPVVSNNNFKVVQINKHLIDSRTYIDMNELNKRKQQVQNEIEYKQTIINRTQTEIDTLKYNSIEERNTQLKRIVDLRSEINTLKTNLLTIARDIDTNATKYGLKDSKPKFRVIGFWEIQQPIYSPYTKAQHIIKYEVQYRYLSKEIDTVDTTTYKMEIEGGKAVTVAFSNWIDLPTKQLVKVKKLDGSFVWEEQYLDSTEEININQCAISISENESVEIRIRALSEAGYPISALRSDWSDIIRVDFPNDLKINNLHATVVQNDSDLSKAEFDEILRNTGLIKHISGTIKESEKTFHHSAEDIASTLYTPEQKNIPVSTVLKELKAEIEMLKTNKLRDNLTVSFIDYNNELYNISNNSTIEINMPAYSSEIDLLDKTKFGTIITKRGYIRIKNNSDVATVINTLQPGNEFTENGNTKYGCVPIVSSTSLTQKPKQIIYFRNRDLYGYVDETNNEFDLCVPINHTSVKKVKTIFNQKTGGNCYGMDVSGNLVECQIDENTNDKLFVGFVKTVSDTVKAKLKSDIQARLCIQNRTEYMHAKNTQVGLSSIESEKENYHFLNRFNDVEQYTIGYHSCGAFLYPELRDLKQIMLQNESGFVIDANSEILIPIVFQYRFVDAHGNIDGVYNNTEKPIYTKKLGVDLLINNSVFRFDLVMNACLYSKVNVEDTKTLSAVVSKYTGEAKEKI